MLGFGGYRYHLAALFVVAVWGTTFVATKVLIAHSLTPAEIFFMRFAIAYLCIRLVLPLEALRTRRRSGRAAGHSEGQEAGRAAEGSARCGSVRLPRQSGGGGPFGASLRDELLLAAAGITGGSLYFLTENIALEYAPASNVSLIVCTAPVWTALLLGVSDRSERMSRRQLGGSALAFVGMALVVLNGRFVLHLSPAGDLLAFAAAWLWVGYSLIVKRIAGRFPPLLLARRIFFYGLVTILPVFLFRRPGLSPELLRQPAVWGNLLYLGVVASMLCYVVWNAVIRRLGAVRATNYIYFNPPVTMLTAACFLGERITPAALAGAALILYGMWQAERPGKRGGTAGAKAKN